MVAAFLLTAFLLIGLEVSLVVSRMVVAQASGGLASTSEKTNTALAAKTASPSASGIPSGVDSIATAFHKDATLATSAGAAGVAREASGGSSIATASTVSPNLSPKPAPTASDAKAGATATETLGATDGVIEVGLDSVSPRGFEEGSGIALSAKPAPSVLNTRPSIVADTSKSHDTTVGAFPTVADAFEVADAANFGGGIDAVSKVHAKAETPGNSWN